MVQHLYIECLVHSLASVIKGCWVRDDEEVLSLPEISSLSVVSLDEALV